MSNNKRAWSDAPGHVVMLVADVEVGLDALVAEQYLRDLANAVNKANYRGYVVFDILEKEKPSKWRAFWEGFSGMWLFRMINFDICYFSFMTILAFFMSYGENYAGAITAILSMVSYFVLMIHLKLEQNNERSKRASRSN